MRLAATNLTLRAARKTSFPHPKSLDLMIPQSPLKAAHCYVIQAQLPKAAWKGQALQALLAAITKCQALKAARPGHLFQPLIECATQVCKFD